MAGLVERHSSITGQWRRQADTRHFMKGFPEALLQMSLPLSDLVLGTLLLPLALSLIDPLRTEAVTAAPDDSTTAGCQLL